MKIFRLNTPLLALVFSIIAEVFLFSSGFIFGSWGSHGPNPYGISGFLTFVCLAFHSYADHLATNYNLPRFGKCVGILIFFFVALFQWWLNFVVSITLSRWSRKKLKISPFQISPANPCCRNASNKTNDTQFDKFNDRDSALNIGIRNHRSRCCANNAPGNPAVSRPNTR
jgi:hypothetical protein